MQKVRRHTLLLRKVVFRLLIELLIHDLFHHSPFSKYKYNICISLQKKLPTHAKVGFLINIIIEEIKNK